MKRILANTSWLSAEKLLRMVAALFVGIWVARYLGPTRYGALNYALALVSLFSAFGRLGLDAVVVQQSVQNPTQRTALISTAFFLRLAASGLLLLLALLAAMVLRPTDATALVLVAILGSGMVFHAFTSIDLHYQAEIRSRTPVMIRSGAFLLVSLAKIGLILMEAPLFFFAAVITVESVLVAVALVLAYGGEGRLLRLREASLSLGRQLLEKCWPLVLAHAVVIIYLRVDQIMIGQFLGDADVGAYSAALRLSEAWYVLPTAVVGSVFPLLIKTRKESPEVHHRYLERLMLAMVWLALCLAVPISLFSREIIQILFGQEYLGGHQVLMIHCWAAVFIFPGLISNQWYLLENLHRLIFFRQLLGVVVNIVLNLLLIPRWGIAGAAWATLITQLASSYLFDALTSRTRPLFFLKSRAFFLLFPLTMRHVSAVK